MWQDTQINALNNPIAYIHMWRKKVKLSHNRPWRPVGLWDVMDPTFISKFRIMKILMQESLQEFAVIPVEEFFKSRWVQLDVHLFK
jgi:hypothetical protein